MIKKQFTLYLNNKPGALAGVTRLLAKRKVNIEGLSAAQTSDMSLVQLVTSNAPATKRALAAAKLSFTTQDVAVLPLRNKPGALAAEAARLARHGVNIDYLYATACHCASPQISMVVVGADDLKKVEQVWNGQAH